ncbi:MAG TPA: hypothetical protein VF904_03830 [Anaeromyxobacteraceae bacterium]
MLRSAKDPIPPRPREDGPGPAELAEGALVFAAVTQGVLVGAWLGLFPDLALRLGGFPPASAFFVRWAGLLHVVLALGYALEWIRFRRVALLVLAKGATALFLAAAWAGEGLPWLMVLALALEGAIATSGALLHDPAERSRRARARLRLVTPTPSQIRPAGRR